MDKKRYITVKQSIIDSCREVKLMRAGILPEPSLEELWEELDKDKTPPDE